MEQNRYGSPWYPGKQSHRGKWLTVWQMAFVPQVPGQGSRHLFLTQALFDGQSEFKTHSGRQPSYGLPKWSSMQVHEPAPFCSRQTAFAPQGDGMHGLICSTTISCRWAWQPVNGSPWYPWRHWQFGMWLDTRHSAFIPQVPGQGSRHFWLIQAKLLGQSLFVKHSGLQFGGAPIISAKHEQDAWSPTTLHSAFKPHGDGTQGFFGASSWGGGS